MAAATRAASRGDGRGGCPPGPTQPPRIGAGPGGALGHEDGDRFDVEGPPASTPAVVSLPA
eukprot:10041040-Alexandrium_andersonii.AAC.1